MTTLPEPSFIDRDPAAVTADLIAMYEQTTGKTLYPAQPERLFIDLIAYREMLLRIQIQETAKQNLVAYAKGIMLDYLGQLVDCNRLDEQAARTTLRFTLSEPLSFDCVISAGTRVETKDEKFIFVSDESLTIPAGQLTGDVTATAETAGADANGYLAGEVNNLADPISHVQGAVNISGTSGGAAVESDDHYRARIKLAPGKYSTAGPDEAYIYWAKTAHQNVIDVGVTSPSGGVVNVYPLFSDGLPSPEILDLVSSVLTGKKRRPLTDHVIVLAPTEVDFTIEADVTLYDWVTENANDVKANIEAVLAAYATDLRSKLGCDQVTSQINGKIIGCFGVYKSVLASPASDRVLADNEWLNCTAINVNIVGYSHG